MNVSCKTYKKFARLKFGQFSVGLLKNIWAC